LIDPSARAATAGQVNRTGGAAGVGAGKNASGSARGDKKASGSPPGAQ
jgi:hypothetical protein